MSYGRSKSTVILLTAALSILATDIALAIDEIVVTTRKLEENLQDVPIAITAIGEQTLKRTGSKGLEDITKFSPSFIFDQNSAQKDVRIAVRGLSATRGRSNVAFLVDGIDVTSEAIGTAGAGLLTSQRLLSDVVRVEAVKGPQSALYGRAAFAGAINYVTKNAPDEFEATIGTEIATQSETSFNGSIGAPITDNFGFLLNGYIFDNEGQYNNAISGSSLGGGKGQGAALTLNFDPLDNLSLKARVEYTDEEYDDLPRVRYLDDVTVFAPNPGGPALNNGDPFQGDYVSSFGSVGNGPILPLRRGENPRTGTDYEGTSQELFRASLVAEWDVEAINGSLKSLTGYVDSKTHEEYDWDANAIGRPDQITGTHDIYNDDTVEIFSQEIRYQSEFDGPVNVIVGANYWTQKRVQTEQGLLGAMNLSPENSGCVGQDCIVGLPTWQEDFAPWLESGQNFRDPRLVEDDHKSIYMSLNWDIGDGWKATLENRYTREVFDQERTVWLGQFFTLKLTDQGCSFTTEVVCTTSGFINDTPPDPANCFNFPAGPCAEPVPQNVRKSSQVKSDFNAPKFTLDWAVNDDAMVYFSVGKGVKPAGLDVLGGGGPPVSTALGQFDLRDAEQFEEAKQFVYSEYDKEREFESEEMWAYELGSKLQFEGALGDLIFNNAFFFQDYSDKQVSVRVVDPITNLTARKTENAGSAEVWGVELETTWFTPVEGLFFTAGYTWLDTEYVKFDEVTSSSNTIAKLGDCIPVNKFGGTDGVLDKCLVSRAGLELERAPQHAATVTGSYTAPLVGNLEWFLEGDAQYQSDRWADAENTSKFDSFWKANFRVGLESDSWEVILFVDNAFDDDTITSGSEIPDFSEPLTFPAPAFVTLGVMPDKRQYGLRASYTF
jgi:outer membrane receptor protein involved in Fe transport